MYEPDPSITEAYSVQVSGVLDGDAALNLREEDYGESFNIGSGKKTSIHLTPAGGPMEAEDDRQAKQNGHVDRAQCTVQFEGAAQKCGERHHQRASRCRYAV